MSTAIATYNELVEQQRTLSQSIETSLDTIASALEAKLQLASQQKQIQTAIGIAYPGNGLSDMREKICDQVARRLEGRASTGRRDWTTRLATAGGNLEE